MVLHAYYIISGTVNRVLRISRGQLRRISSGTQIHLRPVTFPTNIEGPPSLTVPEASILPRRVSFLSLETSRISLKPMTFVSKEALAVGQGRLSQVYRGSLQPCEPAKEATDDRVLDDVVLKIYDGSLFPTGQELDSWDYNCCGSFKHAQLGLGSVFVPHYLAWQEAWVYAKLKSFDPNLVPRFLGVYELDLGKGQVFAIALSYVDGVSYAQWLDHLDAEANAGKFTEDESRRRRFQMARSISNFYWLLRCSGVCILDEFDSNNIKITSSSPPMASPPDAETTQSSSPMGDRAVMFDFDLTVSKEVLEPGENMYIDGKDMCYLSNIVQGRCKDGSKSLHVHQKLVQQPEGCSEEELWGQWLLKYFENVDQEPQGPTMDITVITFNEPRKCWRAQGLRHNEL
ncbi:hypothetical protein BKA70DRAFT_1337550, partial [Coprinopsis sp. MPI-PUGE-AT-0042]